MRIREVTLKFRTDLTHTPTGPLVVFEHGVVEVSIIQDLDTDEDAAARLQLIDREAVFFIEGLNRKLSRRKIR